jgi:hypothetical protein
MVEVKDPLQLICGADIYYVHPVGMAPVPREEALRDLAPIGEEELLRAYEAVSAQFAAERRLLAEDVTNETGRPVNPETLEELEDILPSELKEQSGNDRDADWGIAAAARFSAAFNIPNPDPGLADLSATPAVIKPSRLPNRLAWAAAWIPQSIRQRYVRDEAAQIASVNDVPPDEAEETTAWLELPKIDVDGDDWLKMKKVDAALTRYGDPVKALNYIRDMLKISRDELIKIMARVTVACRAQKVQTPSIVEKVGQINAKYLARRDEIQQGEVTITGVYDYFFPQG